MVIANNLAVQDADQLRNMFVYCKEAVADQDIFFRFFNLVKNHFIDIEKH